MKVWIGFGLMVLFLAFAVLANIEPTRQSPGQVLDKIEKACREVYTTERDILDCQIQLSGERMIRQRDSRMERARSLAN